MKYKYKFDILTTRVGDKIHKKFIIDIENSIELVSSFLESDVQGGDVNYYLNLIDKVLSGESEDETLYGNMCEVIINKDFSEIYDMFADDEKGNWCKIETEELREFIVLWGIEMKKFREKNPY